jgi:glutamine cyclotransferase
MIYGSQRCALAQSLAGKTKQRIEEVVRRLDGHVIAWIDLTGLLPSNQRIDAESVLSLNGIAYDPGHDRLFVTGKRWPTVFELKVIQHTRGTSHSS